MIGFHIWQYFRDIVQKIFQTVAHEVILMMGVILPAKANKIIVGYLTLMKKLSL